MPGARRREVTSRQPKFPSAGRGFATVLKCSSQAARQWLRYNGAVKPGLLAVACALAPAIAHADGRLISDDTFAVHEPGELRVDASIAVALPSALPSGMTTGFTAGIERACGCHLAYGLRAGWGSVTESSEIFTVSHDEFKLRAFGAVRHRVGRGTLELRLGAGPTVVHEDRTRNNGGLAGAMGSVLETTALAALPAAELEGVVALQIVGSFSLVVSAGPSADVFDGHLRGGWTAGVGVGWTP